MPKKGPKKKKASAADKKALAEAVAAPFALGVEQHTAAEAAAEAGAVQQAAQHLDAACGHYRAALEVKATDLDTLFNLGTACLQWSELEGLPTAQAEPLRGVACDHFREVVKLDTSQRSESRADALCNLVALLGTRGDLAFEAGRHPEAEALWAEACALEPSLPADGSALALFNLGEIFCSRAELCETAAGPAAAVPLLEAGVRCFEAVLGKPPEDPPIDIDALGEICTSLLALGRVTSLLPPPPADPGGGGGVAAQVARVEELVGAAASRCAAVEALDPARLDVIMELRMDIARLTASCGNATAAAASSAGAAGAAAAGAAAAAADAAWVAATNACQQAATGAQQQGQQDQELAARALYNAACAAALRAPVDENTAAHCLRSAVEMALAPTNLPGAQADGGGDESSYVSVADLLHDQDLEAVRGCEWFKQLGAQLEAGLADAAARSRPLKELEAELMPLVRQADQQAQAGDCAAALALYGQAMQGFSAAGHPRPKLQAKMDAAMAQLAAAPPS